MRRGGHYREMSRTLESLPSCDERGRSLSAEPNYLPFDCIGRWNLVPFLHSSYFVA